MSNYAIVENSLVINITVSDPVYAQEQGWIEAPQEVTIGWSYVDGQFIAPVPPAPTPEEIQAQNKATAESLLQETDWTCTVDINNPEYSNPYLGNQNEFLTYRSLIRKIAVEPPKEPVTNWPTKPTEVWVKT